MMDYFCLPRFRNQLNSKILYTVEKYLKKKSSIEYIIRKMNEIDKMKFILFTEEEMLLFKMIQDPVLNSQNEQIHNLWKTTEDEKFNKRDYEILIKGVENRNINNLDRFAKLLI
jgi:hypothetical protein